jgi:CD97 antigen
VYHDDRLFPSANRSIAPVIMVRLPGRASLDGDVTFNFTVPHNKDGYVPVYWAFAPGQQGPGEWRRNGCELQSVTTDLVNSSMDVVTTRCTHLTHFTLLSGAGDQSANLAGVHGMLLSGFSFYGVILSAVCLLACAAIHVAKQQLREQLDKRILIHLCTTLAAGLLLFVSGAEPRNDVEVCNAVGLLMHYCFLAAFTWMLVEGINLYAVFVKVRLATLPFDTWLWTSSFMSQDRHPGCVAEPLQSSRL